MTNRSSPLSITTVEAEIMRLCDRSEQLVEEIAARAEEAATLEARYRIGFAQALLCADGRTAAEREAAAMLVVADLLTERKIAEARLLAAQEAGRHVRAQLDALRSLNANVRAVTF